MRIWKISQSLTSGDFDYDSLEALRKAKQVCVYRQTAAKGHSSSTQGYNFFFEAKAGDFFYLCYGNTGIVLFGRFKEGRTKEKNWVYRDYDLICESKHRGPYTKDHYWWTPNDNSTFIEVPSKDLKEFERLILKPYFDKTLHDLEEINKEKQVTLFTESLREVFRRQLRIPAYQRIYCWDERNVIRLLKDCCNLQRDYRLGSIILQKQGNRFDIIDGQQRLVTLSLILQAIGNNESPLLEEKFGNSEAIQYLQYNKWVITNFAGQNKQKLTNKILDYLTFDVLILNSESRELAYTFFSNENSRGKTLTDFDLLKAHHLRYVNEELQAQNLSRRWNKLLLKGESYDTYEERDYFRTLALYIFRLRKWLGYEDWYENEPLRVKKEYEAAEMIPEIPAFGENFDYSEPIQGGAHFFAFVERFVEKYHAFIQMPQYAALHNNLVGETHTWLRDTIETFLFAYYIKFGSDYIDDALILIARIVSEVRYDNLRIHLETILQAAKESKIAMMIDRATSPTFCLAQMRAAAEHLPLFEGEWDKEGNRVTRIRTRYHNCLERMINKRKEEKATYIINPEILMK